MADQKALYLQTSGVAKKILAADSVVVGSGIKSDTGQGLTITSASGDITMANAVAMGTNKITGVGAGSAANDALTYGQSSASLAGLTLTGDLAMGANNITTSGTVDGKDVSTLIAAISEASDTAISGQAGGAVLIWDGSDSWDNQAIGGDMLLASDGTLSFNGAVIVNADIAAAADIAVSKLDHGTTRQVLQTNTAGDGVEWTNDVAVQGILGVTGDTTVAALSINGTVSGTALITDTGLAGAANTNLASALAIKTYTDNKLTGLEWKNSVDVLGLVGNAAVATINGLSPTAGDAYVVTDAGTITSGSISTAIGDVVEYDGSVWIRIAQGSGGFVPDGIRAVLSTTVALISPYTDATDDGKIASFDGTSLTGTLTSDTAANAAILVQDSGSISYYDNLGFTFEGSVPTGSWVQFTGAGQLTAGAGLTKSGNTINVGAGTNITVNADDVAVNTSTLAGTGLENSSNTLRIAAAAAGNGLTGGAGSALAVQGGTAGAPVVAATVTASGVGFDVDAIDGTGLEVDGSTLRIATAAAGDGITGGGGSALAVNVGTGLEIDTDAVRIAAAAAGDGLTGGAGSALAVNVGTGLEIDTDAVRIAAAAAGDGLEGGGGSALSVHLEATNPSLQIVSDELGVKIYADGGLQKTSNGMEVKRNGTTLAVATAGLSVLGVPAGGTWEIGGVAVNATAAHLNELVGSGATTLHTHSIGAANELTFAGTADVALTAGQLVSLDNGGSGNVLLADSNGTDEKPNAVGFVDGDQGTPGGAVNVQLNGEIAVPDAYWPSDTAPAATEIGKRVYMSETPGDVTMTAPTTLGSVVLRVGYLTAGGAGNAKVLIDFGEGIEN